MVAWSMLLLVLKKWLGYKPGAWQYCVVSYLSPLFLKRTNMYGIYDGDFLLFTTDDQEEVEYYQIEGYIVQKV